MAEKAKICRSLGNSTEHTTTTTEEDAADGIPEACVRKSVEFTVPKGGKIGVRLSSSCQISSIKDGSAAQQVLRPGDKIITINGVAVTSRRNLEHEILKVKHRRYKFDILRTKPPYILKDHEIIMTLPKGYDTIPGYQYIIAYMRVYPGADLGLHIMSMDYKVYVTNAPPNTLSGHAFQRADAILAVDDQPTANIRECSMCLTTALCTKKFTKVLIERPVGEVAKKRAQATLNYQRTVDIDPHMPKDIQEISNAAVALISTSKHLKLKNIYKGKTAVHTPKSQRISISEQNTEVDVMCDPFNPELLIHVGRRYEVSGVPGAISHPRVRNKGSLRKKKSNTFLKSLFLSRTQDEAD